MPVAVLVLLIWALSAFVWVSTMKAPGIAGTVSVDDIAVRVRVYWPRVCSGGCRLLLSVVRAEHTTQAVATACHAACLKFEQGLAEAREKKS